MTMDSCTCGSVERVDIVLTENPPETYIATSPVARLQKLIEDCSFEINRIQLHSELEKKDMKHELDINTERIKELEKKIYKMRTLSHLQADYIKKSRNVMYTEMDLTERIAQVETQYQLQLDGAKQKMNEGFVAELAKRDAVVRKKYVGRLRQYQLKVKQLEENMGHVLHSSQTESLGTTCESTCSLTSPPSQDDLHLQRGSLKSHPYFPLGMTSKLRRSLTDLGRSPTLFNEADLRAGRCARCLHALHAHSGLRNSTDHIDDKEAHKEAASLNPMSEVASESSDRPPTPVTSPHGVATHSPARRKVVFAEKVSLY